MSLYRGEISPISSRTKGVGEGPRDCRWLHKVLFMRARMFEIKAQSGSSVALNRRMALSRQMYSRLAEPQDLQRTGAPRANGNLASTPYPANSGGNSLIFINNSVLGGINPSASRAGLR